MNLETIKAGLKTVKMLIGKHAPTIFTGVSIVATIAIIPTSINGTIKAVDIIETENKKREENGKAPMDKFDTVREVWKCYIPAGTAASIAVVSCVMANKINAKRIAGLVSAYTASSEALKLWKEKTQEVVGDKKTSDISAKVSDEMLQNSPYKDKPIHTGKGDQLCMDSMTGQLFYSSVNEIDHIVNLMNKSLIMGEFVSVNDLNYYLGLRSCDMGDMVGWAIEKGTIEAEYDSVLTEDKVPCLVIKYRTAPYYKY